jgi:hypothetical protein
LYSSKRIATDTEHVMALALLVIVSIASLCFFSVYGLLYRDMYLEGSVFRTTDAIGLQQCVWECQLTAKCTDFNYDRNDLRCEFLWPKLGATPRNLIQKLRSTHGDISTFPRVSSLQGLYLKCVYVCVCARACVCGCGCMWVWVGVCSTMYYSIDPLQSWWEHYTGHHKWNGLNTSWGQCTVVFVRATVMVSPAFAWTIPRVYDGRVNYCKQP